ncbi:MFS transporter [Oceanobacillus bengalensis]|uniref:MFS transporter n=1 Tax=Oceanobacillus bengalensis TaxID=1435466 RepID=A0A494YT74_9BACI|nr:MFS transporter [Oceanobacillus bengalensis]RKQ13308.1 MFS transporter [Oceanobacillus bengalensis]
MNQNLTIDEKSTKRSFYIICIGLLVTSLALATHLPAYPAMVGEFQLGAGYAAWMQLGFAFGMTGFQPLFGWLGDYLGQKFIVLVGFIFMAIGSAIVAISPTFWVLILGLFFKGLAGSAIIPVGFAYVGKFFSEEKRGKGLGVAAVYSVVGAAAGPTIAGIFVDTLGWESSFWLTGVLGAAMFLVIVFTVPNVKGDKSKTFDLQGVLLMLLVLIGLLTIPTFINGYGYNSVMWLPSLGVFAIALFFLVLVEKKKKEPLLDISYLSNRHFWVPSVLSIFVFLPYVGVMYLLSFFLQDIQGKPSTLVGLMQLVIFGATAVGNYFVGRWMIKFSPRFTIAFSACMLISGAVLIVFANQNTTIFYIASCLALMGLGIGLIGPANKAVVLAKANKSRIGVTTFTFSTIETTIQRVGASFAIVMFALFSVGGNGMKAFTTTTLILAVFSVFTLLFVLFIPKNVVGFKNTEVDIEGNAKEEKLV